MNASLTVPLSLATVSRDVSSSVIRPVSGRVPELHLLSGHDRLRLYHQDLQLNGIDASQQGCWLEAVLALLDL